jgi:hypothetical protein
MTETEQEVWQAFHRLRRAMLDNDPRALETGIADDYEGVRRGWPCTRSASEGSVLQHPKKCVIFPGERTCR